MEKPRRQPPRAQQPTSAASVPHTGLLRLCSRYGLLPLYRFTRFRRGRPSWSSATHAAPTRSAGARELQANADARARRHAGSIGFRHLAPGDAVFYHIPCSAEHFWKPVCCPAPPELGFALGRALHLPHRWVRVCLFVPGATRSTRLSALGRGEAGNSHLSVSFFQAGRQLSSMWSCVNESKRTARQN